MANNYAAAITAVISVAIPARLGRKGLLIHNVGAKTAYLGDRADLDSTNGFPILSGARLELAGGVYGKDLAAPLNAICGGADTTELRIWDFA